MAMAVSLVPMVRDAHGRDAQWVVVPMVVMLMIVGILPGQSTCQTQTAPR